VLEEEEDVDVVARARAESALVSPPLVVAVGTTSTRFVVGMMTLSLTSFWAASSSLDTSSKELVTPTTTTVIANTVRQSLMMREREMFVRSSLGTQCCWLLSGAAVVVSVPHGGLPLSKQHELPISNFPM
jgi:hypothetical protein